MTLEDRLEVVEVAALVDGAALERGRGGGRSSAPSRLHERAALLEEGGLRRGHDDDVEVVAEARVLRHRAAEQVRHHLLGVAASG